MPFVIGIDGGGTGCRAVLADMSGKPLGTGRAGAANIMTGFDAARKSIVAATEAAICDAALDPQLIVETSAFLGLAGANIGDYSNRISDMLPFRQCRIATDAEISMQGAIGDGDGVVAIIGTGSVFVCRLNNIVRTAGGWGFTVGDLGSGARLGRALLQETLLVYDRIHEGSELTRKVLAKFEHSPQTLVEYAHTALPGEFGTFAPLIFEQAEKQDPIARRLVDRAVSDLEETLDALISDNDLPICMLGGLGEVYRDLLSARFRGRVRPPLGDAASGALALALKHFGSKAGQSL